MKVIAVNGGPRKTWNTAALLNKAIDGARSVGADVDVFHLYDLNYKGCMSCLSCKRVDNKRAGRCAMKDGLSDVLEAISGCDVLLLASPIYFSNVTGEMRSFLERLFFSKLSYNVGHRSIFEGSVASGFIYTMNVTDELVKQLHYDDVFRFYQDRLQILKGASEYLISTDTYQFTDYSKYEASMFDESHKALVKRERFPLDCQKAFDMGARLASAAA